MKVSSFIKHQNSDNILYCTNSYFIMRPKTLQLMSNVDIWIKTKRGVVRDIEVFYQLPGSSNPCIIYTEEDSLMACIYGTY